MKFEYEFKRLFEMWIDEQMEDGNILQAKLIEGVMLAFLNWYDKN